MTSIKKTTGILTSFFVGGVIGGAIGLLYAPKTGKQLRTDISRKTNEFIEDNKKKTKDTWDGAKEIAESTIDNANEILNSNVEKIVRKTHKVKDAVKSGINKYNEESDSENNQNSIYMENQGNLHRERI